MERTFQWDQTEKEQAIKKRQWSAGGNSHGEREVGGRNKEGRVEVVASFRNVDRRASLRSNN